MISYKQNELIKLFVKNISNYSLKKDSHELMGNSKNKNTKELYNKIVKKTKYKPILSELINDYFSNIDKHNSSLDIELPYIIQILALVSDSIESIQENKL